MSSSLDFNKFSADTSNLIDAVFSFEKKVQNFQIKSKEANIEKDRLIGKMNEALKNIEKFGKNNKDPDYQILQSYKATLFEELGRVHNLVDELFNDEINYEKAMGESIKTLPKKLEEEYEKFMKEIDSGKSKNEKTTAIALLKKFEPYQSPKIDAQKKNLDDLRKTYENLERIEKLTPPDSLHKEVDEFVRDWTARIQLGPEDKVKFKANVNKLIAKLEPFEYHRDKFDKKALSDLKKELDGIKKNIELQEKKLEKQKKELDAQAASEKRMSEHSKDYAAARKEIEEELFADFLEAPKPKPGHFSPIKPIKDPARKEADEINERFRQLSEKFQKTMTSKDSTLDEVNKLNEEFRAFFNDISKINEDSKTDPYFPVKGLKPKVISMKTQIQNLKYMLEKVGEKPKNIQTEKKEQKG